MIGLRGFVLKTDSRNSILEAVETVSRHKPYFGGNIPELLLDTYLKKMTKSDKAREYSILTDREQK